MRINTDRCVISSLTPNDISGLAQLNTIPEVRTYLGGPISTEDAQKRLTNNLTNPNHQAFVPRLKSNKHKIGLITLFPWQNTNNVEISYLFFPSYWNNGYARETIAAVITHAFNTQKISHVFAETQSINFASIKLLEHLGMTLSEKLMRFNAEQSIYSINNPNLI